MLYEVEAIVFGKSGCNSLTTHERRIADEGIEPAPILEYLRELTR